MIELSFSGLSAMISLAAAITIQKIADSKIAICLLLTIFIVQTALTTLNHLVSYKPISLFPLPLHLKMHFIESSVVSVVL